MRAITILQPWATAIAVGAKRIETRGRQIHYRGPMAIHAGKSTEYLKRLIAMWHMGSVAFPHGPFGCENYLDLWNMLGIPEIGSRDAARKIVAMREAGQVPA